MAGGVIEKCDLPAFKNGSIPDTHYIITSTALRERGA